MSLTPWASRQCASKWWHRYLELGTDGLHDRSSRPRCSPRRTSEHVEAKICRQRRAEKVGPDRLAIHLDVAPSTIYRVLRRHDLSRLSHLDRQTSAPIRRYERARAGELIHVDVKKLGRIPLGGGHRSTAGPPPGRTSAEEWATPISTPPSTTTAAGLHRGPRRRTGRHRGGVLAPSRGVVRCPSVVVERVLTDNHFSYRGRLFNQALAEHRILHKYCRPYRPQTNGKVERFHRTLLEEWAYVRPYACEAVRTRALARWLHRYNHHRVHTAIGGPPISRVTNVPREHI